jgi:hypothetical protein
LHKSNENKNKKMQDLKKYELLSLPCIL